MNKIKVELDYDDWLTILEDLNEVIGNMQVYVDHSIAKYKYRQDEYRKLVKRIEAQLETGSGQG